MINISKGCFLMLSLLIMGNVQAKDLTIHRCVLANGTLAYQEKPCAKKKPPKPSSSTHHKSHTRQKKGAKLIRSISPAKKQPSLGNKTVYQEIATLNDDPTSIARISDQVRGYAVSMSVLKQWRSFKKVYNNKLLNIKISAGDSAQDLSLLIDFIFPDHKKFSDNELQEIVYLLGSQFMDRSNNQQLIINKINVTNGKGMMTTVDINHKNSAYRYITKGAIYKSEWLIQFTLKSNDLNNVHHQFALKSLAHSIQITK